MLLMVSMSNKAEVENLLRISSHVGPRYGEKHEQVKLVEVLVHVPPFLQGLGAQRSPAKGNES